MTWEKDLMTCPNCRNMIDNCDCTCPYCGQIEEDDCAIGYGRATGGG